MANAGKTNPGHEPPSESDRSDTRSRGVSSRPQNNYNSVSILRRRESPDADASFSGSGERSRPSNIYRRNDGGRQRDEEAGQGAGKEGAGDGRVEHNFRHANSGNPRELGAAGARDVSAP